MEKTTAAKFSIGRFLLGGKHFALTLEFATSGQVSGKGRISQSTNPPLSLSTTVSGACEVLGAGDTGQVITLTGHEASTGLVNVHATLTINSKNRKIGVASYKHLNNPGEWVEELRVPVSVKWLKST